jgi:hypothetical protein
MTLLCFSFAKNLQIEALSLVVAVLVAAFGYVTWYVKRREEGLRYSDVLAWSNQAISAMQTLQLICKYGESYYSTSELDAKLKELGFTTSILIEQGRMFFRNQEAESHGQEKEPAYRGFRPRILDPLLVAHLIARRWLDGNAESRARMYFVAETHVQKFVSLVQEEVGRSRTASTEAKSGGDKIDLDKLMTKVPPAKVEDFLKKRP